jgi:crossover junction endodeoxyribonuclease RuvC
VSPEARGERPRILGVDPGSLATGWGLIAGDAAQGSRLLECGVIRLSSTTGLAGRLHHLQREFESLVHRISPSCAAVESPYHGANARSALQLAHARGVILASLAGAGIEVFEYSPATVKKSVTGNGRAPKPQVHSMVARVLSSDLARPHDLSDALAVALCHASHSRYHAAVTRGGLRSRQQVG